MSPHHNQTIPDVIAPFVKKVFQNLLKESLMERCVLGATQHKMNSSTPQFEIIVQRPSVPPLTLLKLQSIRIR